MQFTKPDPGSFGLCKFRVLLCAMLCVSFSACGEPTVGQQFRDIMAEIDAKCRKEKLGPYLDQNEPPLSRKRTNGSCEILKLKPADPMATEEGRFAYSIKLPPPHDKPKVEYKKGMSAESYFKELCEKEAGEWIFKTVERVEGVFQGRNLNTSNVPYSSLVAYLYEPTEITSRNLENSLVQPISGRYNYLERPARDDEVGQYYVRFFRGAVNKKSYPTGYSVNKHGLFRRVPYIVDAEQTQTLQSRYGFTWRQVDKKEAIENGIVGGETIIFDRTTNEVLAFRRFFYRYWPQSDSKYTRLANHDFCRPRFAEGGPEFVQRVLLPINPVE